MDSEHACPTCGRTSIEPLYSLEVAAELIPMRSMSQLWTLLSRRAEEFPPRYYTGTKSPVRMLTLTEIIKLREHVIATSPNLGGQRKKGVRQPRELSAAGFLNVKVYA